MTVVHRMPRRIDALPALCAFVDDALADAPLDHARRQAVHFVLEELVTNMIKYAPQGAPTIAVEIVCGEAAVDLTVTDRDVDRFDPTDAPTPDIDAPLGERRPGGLGLHLVRRLASSFEYTYLEAAREGRTRVRIGSRAGSQTDADA